MWIQIVHQRLYDPGAASSGPENASVTHWVVVGTRFWPAAVLFCPSSAHTALQGSCHPWGQGQVLPEAHEALHDLPGPSLPSPQCPLCFTNRSS